MDNRDRARDMMIQETVERRVNPVPFGRWERAILWLIALLASVSAIASVATFLLTY